MPRHLFRGGPMRRRSALILGAVATVAGAVAVVVVPNVAQAAVGCSVAYQNVNAWQSSPTSGGFNATLAITNLGDPISHWTLTFTPPGGQAVTSGWNATFTIGSTVSATDAGWNGPIATGATNTSVGMQGTWTRSSAGSTPPNPF